MGGWLTNLLDKAYQELGQPSNLSQRALLYYRDKLKLARASHGRGAFGPPCGW